MARRKEVFQSKVLQRLYPAALKVEKEQSLPRTIGVPAKKIYVKRKASPEDPATGDTGNTHSATNPGRRMYTVLPPPADYKADSQESVTLSQLESINSAKDTAEESAHGSNEEDKGEEQRRKRRRKKRKPTLHRDSGKDEAAPVSESSLGQSQMPEDEGGEHISRNKKRKLKKKRRKEKLLSTGLMPRATALEFTYRKDGEEEEEEEEEEKRKAAEVSDFLRTTMEIYLSDSSLNVNKPLLSATLDDLLGSIASGCESTSFLKQLYSLKALVQQKETNKLEKMLEELSNTSPMSAEETTAVVSLFRYWITDILPMQGDKKTGLSATHP